MTRLPALLLVTLLLGCLASLTSCGRVASQGEQTAQATLYTCSMHPQVVQEAPGTCPICGMDLVPMGTAPASTGVVHVDPDVLQSIGVRTAPARRQTIFKHLRTIGEVDVAEDQVSVVNLRLSGWVERIHVQRTGDPVRKGEVLFDLYSPEAVAAQEELLLALRAEGPESPLARSARRKLELWDLADADIDAVVKAGSVRRTVPVRSPGSGFVLAKQVVEGARVQAGQDLYRIGDLRTIWVNAEVYEFDAPWVEVGQPAQMELSFQQGTVLQGKVGYIHPTLNPASRTLRVRLEFDNPGVSLKPGMFATVYIQFRRQDDVLAIPTEAIVRTGEREIVFVATGGGHFEPHEVTTGLEADHHLTEVLSGLSQGDEVVTSGQFLLDAESQLQEAVDQLLAARRGDAPPGDGADDTVFSCPMHPEVVQDGPGRCPECGMFLERRPRTSQDATHDHAAEHGAAPAEGLYTCPMHPEVRHEGPGRCPECNMFLEPVEAEGTTP